MFCVTPLVPVVISYRHRYSNINYLPEPEVQIHDIKYIFQMNKVVDCLG